MTNATPLDAARERLLAMRDEEIARIIKRSASAQLAGLEAAIAALDEIPTEALPASRAVVNDDGQEIRLTLHGETGAVAAAPLDPVRAIGLAGELIAAALPKLS
jgi:hypothetical protein